MIPDGLPRMLPELFCTMLNSRSIHGNCRALVQGMDFHRDTESLQDEMIPQHNFKITANSLEGRHYGEVACRDFRESVLAVMPHR